MTVPRVHRITKVFAEHGASVGFTYPSWPCELRSSLFLEKKKVHLFILHACGRGQVCLSNTLVTGQLVRFSSLPSTRVLGAEHRLSGLAWPQAPVPTGPSCQPEPIFWHLPCCSSFHLSPGLLAHCRGLVTEAAHPWSLSEDGWAFSTQNSKHP